MDDRRTTWERIARTELEHEGVSPGTGFGRSEGLRMGGKIYAIDKDDELILKLPAERVEELIGTDAGHAWGPAPGRIMREWIAIPGTRRADWAALTSEARAFVAQANESGPEPQPRDVARGVDRATARSRADIPVYT